LKFFSNAFAYHLEKEMPEDAIEVKTC